MAWLLWQKSISHTHTSPRTLTHPLSFKILWILSAHPGRTCAILHSDTFTEINMIPYYYCCYYITWNYLVNCKNYEVPRYAVFSGLLLRYFLSCAQIFPSTPWRQTQAWCFITNNDSTNRTADHFQMLMICLASCRGAIRQQVAFLSSILLCVSWSPLSVGIAVSL